MGEYKHLQTLEENYTSGHLTILSLRRLAFLRPGLWLSKLTGVRTNSCVRTMRVKMTPEVKEKVRMEKK